MTEISNSEQLNQHYRTCPKSVEMTGEEQVCWYDVDGACIRCEGKQEADSFPTDADKESDRVAAMEKVVTAAEIVRAGVRYGYAPEIGQLAIIEALDEYHEALSRPAEEATP